jgi:hypothetical protein
MDIFWSVNKHGSPLRYSYGQVRQCLYTLSGRGVIKRIEVPGMRMLYWGAVVDDD